MTTMIKTGINVEEYQRAVSELRILVEMVEIQATYFNKYFKGSQKMAYNKFVNSHSNLQREVDKLGDFKGAGDILDGVAGCSLEVIQHVWKSDNDLEDVLEKLK